MQMNKYRYLFTVLVMWWQGTVLSSTCVHPDLAICTTAYTDSLTGPVLTHKEQFCKVLQTYQNCVAGICKTVPKDMMDYIIKAQTNYNFDCGITGASVRVTPPVLLCVVFAILTTVVLR